LSSALQAVSTQTFKFLVRNFQLMDLKAEGSQGCLRKRGKILNCETLTLEDPQGATSDLGRPDGLD